MKGTQIKYYENASQPIPNLSNTNTEVHSKLMLHVLYEVCKFDHQIDGAK